MNDLYTIFNGFLFIFQYPESSLSARVRNEDTEIELNDLNAETKDDEDGDGEQRGCMDFFKKGK